MFQRSLRVTYLVTICFSILTFTTASRAGANFQEDFETFTPGAAVGQNGWTSDDPDRFTIENIGKSSFGRASASYVGQGNHTISQDLILSPPFGARAERLAVDVLIIGSSSISYLVGPRDDGAGIQNTYARFNPDGTIDIFQELQYLGIWLRSSGIWTPGDITRIGFEVDDYGSLMVYQDGQSIFSGRDMANPFFGSSGMSSLVVKAMGSSANGTQLFLDNLKFGTDDGSEIFGGSRSTDERTEAPAGPGSSENSDERTEAPAGPGSSGNSDERTEAPAGPGSSGNSADFINWLALLRSTLSPSTSNLLYAY